MKMKCCFLLLLYFAVNHGHAATTSDVKRGMHTFMAFIYYTDPSVLDISGERLVRSAVLIRPDWLVTTAIGPSLMDPKEFPEKTLLARAGAITIDSKFMLNEDEDEQEREIVQIVRPYNHSATQWWTTDISLMKTLLPFNMTSAVGIKTLNFKQPDLMEAKTCTILVYARKYKNSTEDKSLMALYVDLLPLSVSTCGSHFTADTMACASDSNENKGAVYDADFCQGNSGGPLICNKNVIGLQTYIGNNCAQPHLYQLLYPWANFITCSVENKCQEEQCGDTCDIIYKDPPKTEEKITPPVTYDAAQDITAFLNVPSTEQTADMTITEFMLESTTVEPITTTAEEATVTELVTKEFTTTRLSDASASKETEPASQDTTTDTFSVSLFVITEPPGNATVTDQTSSTTKTETTYPPWPKIKVEKETVWVTTDEIISITNKSHWPKERVGVKHRDDEEVQRKTDLEAQHAPEANSTEVPPEAEVSQETEALKVLHFPRARKPRLRSTSNRNLSVFQSVLFGFVVLLCL